MEPVKPERKPTGLKCGGSPPPFLTLLFRPVRSSSRRTSVTPVAQTSPSIMVRATGVKLRPLQGPQTLSRTEFKQRAVLPHISRYRWIKKLIAFPIEIDPIVRTFVQIAKDLPPHRTMTIEKGRSSIVIETHQWKPLAFWLGNIIHVAMT